MPTYNELMEVRELLDFSQNFSVARNYMGSALFPDRKVQYIEAEYSRFARNGNLPQAAMVHAYDTEAHIASRIPIERVSHEQLLIKEKINQTEAIRKVTRGMRMDGVKSFVFDDIARMAEMVVTRVEVAKMEVLATGKMTIDENGFKTEIDYGMPDENRIELAWGDADADVIGDLRAMRKVAMGNGVTPNTIVTTDAVVTAMLTNAGIQKAIFGTAGVGMLPALDQLNALLRSHVGCTVTTNDAAYGVAGADENGNTVINQKRFFPEGALVMTAVGANGALGTGLWGVTPEEEAIGGAFDTLRQQQFVTVTQWTEADPVGVWTKASGLALPVLPNIYGHIVATVDTQAADDEQPEG